MARNRFLEDHPLNDDGKLKTRYYNKGVNAKKEGIEFRLTQAEFVALMEQAGVRSSQLGIRGYHLSRHGDTGAYEPSNCVFVPYIENIRQRKATPKSRAASARNALLALSAARTPEGIAKQKDGFRKYIESRRPEAGGGRSRRPLHQSYVGSRNSQFGKYWITDGSRNLSWRDSKGSIPDGFRRGRVMK